MNIYNIVKTEVTDDGLNATEKSIVAAFTDKNVAEAFANKMEENSDDWSSYSVERETISNGFVEVGDIEWDVDDEEDLETLPKLVFIPNGELNPDVDLEDAIGDWLSNTYGYCHKGFTYEDYNT